MYKILSFFFVALILTLSIQADPSEALIVPGPDLTQNEGGWADFGLLIRAEQNVNLVSFRYPNQGQADVIELRLDSDGSLLTSIPTPAGNTNIVVNINYPLTAGVSYRLVATTPSNRKYVSFSAWPVGNAEITVLSSFGGGSPQTLWWFSFNDITTSSSNTVSVSGTVTYTGTGTGPISIAAFDGEGCGDGDYTEVWIPGPGPYTLDLSPGAYYICACRDTNQNGSCPDPGEPASEYELNPLTVPAGAGPITGINISLQGQPQRVESVPTMTEWGMIIFIVLAGLGSVYYLRRQRRA
jgi:hypothetical protein